MVMVKKNPISPEVLRQIQQNEQNANGGNFQAIKVNRSKDLDKLAKIKKKQKELKIELQEMQSDKFKKKELKNNKIISKIFAQDKNRLR